MYRDEQITDGSVARETEIFLSNAMTLLLRHRETLLGVAYASIDHGLAHGKALAVDARAYAPELRADGATFVTLRRSGDLAGCVGRTEPCRPLIVDVADNAFAAANHDNRFSPLNPKDRTGLTVSVTAIGPRTRLFFRDEDDLMSQIRPGEDGLIIENSGRRALFLPQVWLMLPEPERFLSQLKLKTGLPADAWHTGYRAWRLVARSVSSDERSS